MLFPSLFMKKLLNFAPRYLNYIIIKQFPIDNLFYYALKIEYIIQINI